MCPKIDPGPSPLINKGLELRVRIHANHDVNAKTSPKS